MYNILNVIASNAAFGSSSKRISLSLAIVLQIASRCHCPPDNCTPFSNQYPICCFGLSQIESGILYFFISIFISFSLFFVPVCPIFTFSILLPVLHLLHQSSSGVCACSNRVSVEGCFCQPILCRRHRQLAACGQIVHPQDEPSRFFGTAAAGALAVVDIAQRPEQDAFVGTVEFNFTFQFFLQCQLYIGKRLRFALKAIQLKKFQK